MVKIIQHRSIEKNASLFTKEHLINILSHTAGVEITDRTALRLLVPSIIEKTAYIRGAKNISISEHAAKGGLLGGALFTPYGMQAAGAAGKGLKAKRKAFMLPVAIGAGLTALTKGLLAKGDKDLIRERGRKVIKEVNIRDKEEVAATRGATRGLITGITTGTAGGAIVGKLLGSRFKKFKGVGAMGGAIWGGSLAGLGGAAVGEHKARRKFKLKNVWNY